MAVITSNGVTLCRSGAFTVTRVVTLLLLLAGCSSRPEKVVDQDGNSYNAVQIGSMVWTGKNLDVAHYRNGDAIPEVKDPEAWALLKTGAWCYNSNRLEHGKIYGKLYNWYAVKDPRGLAPKGWHVATDAEWNKLGELLGGSENAGGAIKSATLWRAVQGSVNGKSGFEALPGGARRDNDGYFMPPGDYSRLWSSTESGAKSAWGRSLGYYDAALRRGMANKNIGFSVRCVKD
ncbi:fibrobacter succinogenes major paralogous domain-containing protein [Chlorobium ferrooxidans]|uniref:Fibrobacter succinogenes major paralogous domain-containing protein n=1 Tax=Chlorobium ferrooxidans DSM 13031 TaxID=377431 RepID=Q0YP79_9CHLB|nr:fibrobacter succinogenes major paralogous domain-containing protein [Chlorobium ferrooxidans]EAT58109.1 hypothetical protein CferDRAFT_0096 [Chlorobium ferrooxidans DSM 13031]